jgi:hypothetical protein
MADSLGNLVENQRANPQPLLTAAAGLHGTIRDPKPESLPQ